MNIVLLILVIITLYWLSGFSRAISPKNNRWHAWGTGNQVWGWIDGDKKTLLPYSMPYPFRSVFRHLFYTQFVEDGRTEAYTETSKEGKLIKYHKAMQIKGIKKPIRTVEEEVTRLRKKEIHPYLVTIHMPISGLTFFLVFTPKLKVYDPMDTLDLDEFLVFFGNELNDAVYPWGPEQESQWISDAVHKTKEDVANPDNMTTDEKKHSTDVVIDNMLALRVDKMTSFMIPLENGEKKNLFDYLNDKMEKYGFCNLEFSLDVGFDENVEVILNARNKQKQQMEKTKLEDIKSETADVIRERHVADREKEREQNIADLNNVHKPLLQEIAATNATANGAWKTGTTVIYSGSNPSDLGTSMLATILKNTQKVTGSVEEPETKKGGADEKTS